MNEYKYTVLLDGEVVASNMSDRNAIILEKALLDEYWGETSLCVTIVRKTVNTTVEDNING